MNIEQWNLVLIRNILFITYVFFIPELHERLSRMMNHLLTPLFQAVLEYGIQLMIPGVSFEQVLLDNFNKLDNLRRRKILNDPQMDSLYPPAAAAIVTALPTSAATSSEEFDVTLLMVLARNLRDTTTNKPVFTPPCSNWDIKNLLPTNTTVAADLIRIRDCRNTIHHHTKIPEPEFKQIAGNMMALVGRLDAKLVGSPFEKPWLNTLKDVLVGETVYI